MAADQAGELVPSVDDFAFRDQVDMVIRAAPLAAWVSVTNALILVYVLWGAVAGGMLLAWLGAVAAVFAARLLLRSAYMRANPGPRETDAWARRLIVTVAMAGICWGALGSILFPVSGTAHQILVAFVIAGMSAGALVPLSPLYSAYALYLLGAVTPLAVTFILQGGEVYPVMGLLCLVYLVGLLIFGRQSHVSVLETLRLKYDKERLIDELTVARGLTEDINQELQHEIRERERAEEAERQEKQRLMLHVAHTPLAVIEWNRTLTVLSWNPAAARIFGYAEQDALGQPLPMLVFRADQRETARAALAELFLGRGGAREEHENVTRDGRSILCEWYNTPLIDHEGNITGVATLVQDVTARRLREAEIEHRAYHDPLTGLPNRILLGDRLKVMLIQARRRKTKVAVLFADLDDFKRINDEHGHDAGDHVLKCLASRLRTTVRQEDTVARYGGDEFVLALAGIGRAEDAAAVARKTVEVLAEPIPYHGRSLRVTPSVGVSLYPDHAESPEMLVSFADAAMYRAKQDGGNRERFAAPGAVS
ncbi:MAG TPA: diguanylate cyclase [Pelomicrobium sp.]|nr:diguanylate cyclase [Pelomicrobium sp.]